MKKFCNYIMFFLAFLIFASCKNIDESEPTLFFGSTNRTLVITTGSGDAGGYRSILPSSPDYSSLTYYFAIENLVSSAKSCQSYAASNSDLNVNFPIVLEAGYYKISVYALTSAAVTANSVKLGGSYGSSYNAGDLRDWAILTGSTIVDLRSDETVSVKLSTEGLPSNGSASLKLYSNGWTFNPSKYQCTAYMKNYAGTIVGTDSKVVVSLTNSAPSSVSYYAGSVSTGVYKFCVDFTNLADPTKVYTWSDSIFILSNQVIEKTIGLPDVIQYAPLAPSNFRASYARYDNDPETIFYKVNFAWTDNSNNEQSFQIDLKSVTSAQSESDFTPGDMAASWAATTGNVDSFTISHLDGVESKGIATCIEGAASAPGPLVKNTNEATFRLQKGARYLARIKALAYSGCESDSDYCYLTFTTGSGKSGYTAFDPSAAYMKVE